jgi:hypothetical protein
VRGVIGVGTRARAGRRCSWAVAAVAVALAAGGCAGAPEVSGSDASPTTAAPPSVAGHSAGTFPAPLPHPTDDAASQDAALTLGAAAVTAFARPDIAPDQWWAELTPLLSPAAAVAYEGTDPEQVPAREVTGPAWSGTSPSSFLATVFVPTDAGEYAVMLVREGSGAPWLVERISRVQAEPTPTPAPPTDQAGP